MTMTQLFDAHRTRDPTQTLQLRKSFRATAKLRLRQVRAAMRVAVTDQNVLGLGEKFIFAPAHTRLDAFTGWLQATGGQYLLGADWAGPYIRRAWRAGEHKAMREIGAGAGPDRSDDIVALARIEIEGILAATVQQASRAAASIITRNIRRPQALRLLHGIFDKVAQPRLVVMADVLAIKAYNEAKLSTYSSAGLRRVGIHAETLPYDHRTHRMDAADRAETPEEILASEEELVGILTAGDNKVCQLCEDWADDAPYEIEEVRDVYPLHPRCRCAVYPWEDLRFKGEDAFEDYDPDEPRAPAGSAEGGQWIKGAAGELWGGAEHGEKVTPKQLEAVKKLAESTPGMKDLLPYLAADEVNKIKKVNAKRMVEAFTTFPVEAEEMAAVAFSGSAKRGWYDKSARAVVDVFGAVDAPRFVCLMAALSPQTGVEDNAINALNSWVNWVKAGRPTDRGKIIEILGQSVQGEKGAGSILPAWINNSVTALSTHEPESIVLSGPKVDSFAYNLRGAVNAVTNDTWMANYFGIEQKQFARKNPIPGKTPGKGPFYIATAAMTRKAAEIITEKTGDKWTPDQIQETIWSWAKTLYERASKDKTTVSQLLKAGSVTSKDIADTPDFAILFTQNVYRKILELGGYGKQAAALAAGSGGAHGFAGERSSLLASEGSGFTQSAFERHLFRAAERLDIVRVERAKRKAAKAEEDGLDDAYDPDEPRDPAGKWTTGGGAHPGEGYSASARVDEHGVIHTSNVYDAQRALFENRKVELKQLKQVSTLIQRLGETAAEMAEHGETAPVFNLCNVSIEGTNLFCSEHKGIPRVKMPVIARKQTKAFVKYLESQGYDIEKDSERADHLRATQDEISGEKVAASMARIRNEGFYKRIVVSNDDYILDGHHTWAAQLGVDAQDNSLKDDKHVKVYRVDIPIIQLLAEAEKWTGGKGKKAASEAVKKRDMDEQLSFDWNPSQPRDPAGTSTGGRWTSGMASAVAEGDKMLLVTHNPSHEQFDKWEIQIQERQNELEKQGQVGGDEDNYLDKMKNALKEFRAAKLEDKDSGKIGFSAVYGGPREADDTKLLAATLVRYSDEQKVARITLSGGTDRDAHTKSLQMIVMNYGGRSTRIEGAAWGSDIETVLRYEQAGFKLAGETSTGLMRLIHGDPEMTEFEKKARAMAELDKELTRQAVVRDRATLAAKALDFDPKLVKFTDEDRQFRIGGSDKKYNYAGSYTRGDNAVMVYYKHCSASFAASCTAHEIGHRKLDALRARVRDEREDVHNEPGPHADPNGQYWWQKRGGKDAVMAPDGTLHAPYDKKYPFYQAWQKLSELNYNKLRDDDGVSDYSKQYWEGYLHGNVGIDSAFHETIAELSRLKLESGKLQGSKEWNAVYRLMEEHWAQMTPQERELKQPSSEKVSW